MLKKLGLWVCAGFLMLNVCGCFALLAGGVLGGAGTAVWLSGKLSQQFHAGYLPTVKAAKKALHSEGLAITKQTAEDNQTQFKSNYTDGREIWIDVKHVDDQYTKVDVRVGVGDKNAAAILMKRIGESL